MQTMKKWLVVAAILPASAPLFAAPKRNPTGATAKNANISATPKKDALTPLEHRIKALTGLKVKLELQEELYGKHSQIGQVVHYLVSEDVIGPNKNVIIKKGAPATGRVLDAQGVGGRFSWKRKGGKLDFNAEYATAVDGAQLPLIFDHKSKGLGGGGIVILFGPGRGKDARAHKGRIYEATIGTPPVQPAVATPAQPATQEQDKSNAHK